MASGSSFWFWWTMRQDGARAAHVSRGLCAGRGRGGGAWSGAGVDAKGAWGRFSVPVAEAHMFFIACLVLGAAAGLTCRRLDEFGEQSTSARHYRGTNIRTACVPCHHRVRVRQGGQVGLRTKTRETIFVVHCVASKHEENNIMMVHLPVLCPSVRTTEYLLATFGDADDSTESRSHAWV